jgi:hypothetical protein
MNDYVHPWSRGENSKKQQWPKPVCACKKEPLLKGLKFSKQSEVSLPSTWDIKHLFTKSCVLLLEVEQYSVVSIEYKVSSFWDLVSSSVKAFVRSH